MVFLIILLEFCIIFIKFENITKSGETRDSGMYIVLTFSLRICNYMTLT